MKFNLPLKLRAALLAAILPVSAFNIIVQAAELPALDDLPFVADNNTEFILSGNTFYDYQTETSFSTGAAFSTSNASSLLFTSAEGERYSLGFTGAGSSNAPLRAISSGADGAPGGVIGFSRLHNISFSGNSTNDINQGGGAIQNFVSVAGGERNMSMGVSFTDISGRILFENNSANHGGAITVKSINRFTATVDSGESNITSGLVFERVYDDIVFSGNTTSNYGGAINVIDQVTVLSGSFAGGTATTTGGVAFREITGNINFTGNITRGGGAIKLEARGIADAGSAGNVTVDSGIAFERIKGNITFSENVGSLGGGAIDNVVYATANRNCTVVSTGNILFSSIEGDIAFIDNRANLRGGAINIFVGGVSVGGGNASGVLIFENIEGDVLFSGNQSIRDNGGAIYSGGDAWNSEGGTGLSIRDVSGTVMFENNFAGGYGGAICLEMEVGDAYNALGLLFHNSLFFSADGGDIIFQGNTMGGAPEGVIANAIYITAFVYGSSAEGDAVPYLDEFRASEGRTVAFYDPIVEEDSSNVSSVSPHILHLNRTDSDSGKEYTGEILFSGERVTDYIIQDAESDAEYQARIDASKTSVIRQNTELLNGTLHVAHGAVVEMNSFVVAGAEAKTTFDGLIRASSIQLNGALFDMETIYTQSSPLALDTVVLTGNSLTVYNKTGDLYSRNGILDEDRAFAILTLQNDADFGALALDDFVDDRSGSQKYGNQGVWELVWDLEAASAEDPAHTLYAVWTYTGYLEDEEILEELIHDSGAVSHSLWSSRSNMLAFSRSALGQLGSCRYTGEKDMNYWAMGLGDFNMVRSSGELAGYDYWGGGYAVGADTRIGKNIIAGVAFAQLVGTNQSRTHHSSNDQNSLMGLIYAGYRQQLSADSGYLRYEMSLGYGSTSNKMKSYDSRGQYAHGSWDNSSYLATLRASWDCAYGKGWTLSPFIGLEYTSGIQDAFTETGREPRHFDKGRLYNLSLPVGIEATHAMGISSGMVWTNSIALSYVPDVYRENPDAAARRMESGTTWISRGSSPTRNAGRLDISSRLQINSIWAAFAGYQLEARDDSVHQNVNLGLSASF